MLKNNLGDIVLIPFPFSDLSDFKVRPAVVLAFDRDDVVVVFISSVLPKLDFLEIKTTNENGLKINSFIKYTKIASIDRKLVQGSIGNLNEKNFKNLKNKIKIFLNL